MSEKRYTNTTDSSVVIDEEGHTLDGGASDELKVTKQVRHAVDLGLLVESPEEAVKGRTAEQKKHIEEAADDPKGKNPRTTEEKKEK